MSIRNLDSFRAPALVTAPAATTTTTTASPKYGYPQQDSFAVLGTMQGADVEALAFLTMMNASKSAQEDLKAIMAGVKGVGGDRARIARRPKLGGDDE